MITVQHSARDDRIYFKEALSLVGFGWNVTILYADSELHDENSNGVHLCSVLTPTSRYQKFLKKTYRGEFYREFIKRAIDVKAAVYIAHEPQSIMIALQAAEQTSAQMIFDSHESLQFQNVKDTYALHTHLSKVQNFIAVNDLVKADILQHVPDAQVQVIRNSSIFESSPCLSKDEVTVCFEGSLGFNRGLKEMTEVFVELLDVRKLPISIKIIGELYGKEKEFFEEQCIQTPVLKNIQFTGWVAYEQVQKELEVGSIGLIMNHPTPNNKYSSPNKLFNYIACNMCVLSVDLPFISALVEKYNNGLIIKDLDPNEFADRIEQLYNDPKQLMTYRLASHAAHKELSWERESVYLDTYVRSVIAAS